MKNLFNDISHDERRRILEMHENATKKHYLNEQVPQPETQAPQTGNTQTGGTSNTDKLTVLKTDEAKRELFVKELYTTLRQYLGQNVFKDPKNPQGEEIPERAQRVRGFFRNALLWYAMNGRNPEQLPLSKSIDYIERAYPNSKENYESFTGTGQYQSVGIMKVPQLDGKFNDIYKYRLTLI
jgi:hypothetical protein